MQQHLGSAAFVIHFISALTSLWNWSHGLVPQRGNTQEVATKTGNCGQRLGIPSDTVSAVSSTL